ncbi:hypothetical protein B0A49_07692 [Cryomyces minteri]|uniref:Uncharacterized protein n=1 Tax=Cryomyces minteri TaxID=331657 RepID=A0A4U0X3B0_9PEZI|nr:hypothetical protein B0A49_07692 [Cryomyces minteri]
MVSWQTTTTLLSLFGVPLVSKGLALYRSARASAQNIPIRPTPPHVNRALNILFVSALLFLLSSLPYFTPANIFQQTQSRLAIPTDVLFARLAAARPLTHTDHALKAKFHSPDARLLYLHYGPDVVANCQFCRSDGPGSYLVYALPSLLLPHLAHLAVLGLATSSLLAGPEGSRFRTPVTLAGVALAAADVYLVASHAQPPYTAATTTTVGGHIDAFFWKLRLYRSLALTVADLSAALLLWTTATNRLLALPPRPAERMEHGARTLELALAKLKALGSVRNVVFRDAGLRDRVGAYWTAEGAVTRAMFEEREVVEGVRAALARADMGGLMEQADRYTEGVFAGVEVVRTPMGAVG